MRQLEAILKIMLMHEQAITDEDGGVRPFNREGETLEAIWHALDDDEPWLLKAGWLDG